MAPAAHFPHVPPSLPAPGSVIVHVVDPSRVAGNHLSVAENVELPLRLLGRPDPARVAAVLQAVGLGELGARAPAQLSGGQLQRVAIARAVVHAPALILADEPTGNLDPTTAARVLSLLVEQVRGSGAACLLVTHSEAAAARADRVLRLTAEGVA